MKKIQIISLVLCAMLLNTFAPLQAAAVDNADDTTAAPSETTGSAVTEATQAPVIPEVQGGDASISNGCRGLNAQVPLRTDAIFETASGGLLYEVNSGTLVYGTHLDEREYPGGFVKLMTCLIALENGALTDQVEITQEMVDQVPKGSKTLFYPLLAGEVLPLEDLLYAVMVHSANDAAVAVAEYIAGSQDAFVAMMNKKAEDLGCTGTHFVNVHGVHDDEQYTTIRDLAKIVAYGIQNEDYVALLTTEQYFMSATEQTPSSNRTLYSDNYMMGMMIMEEYYDYRVLGGKVATNKDNQRSLVVLARSNGLYYVGIVMDTVPERKSNNDILIYNEFVEMDKLLDLGFQNYQVSQVLYEGQITSRFNVTNGENGVAVGPTKTVMSVLPGDVSFNDLTLRFQRTGGTLNAPIEKGTTLDILQVWYGSVCIAQSELVAMNSSKVAAAQANSGASDFDAIDLQGLFSVMGVLAVIVGIILVLIGVLYIIRFVRVTQLRSRRRRRRNSRRRTR